MSNLAYVAEAPRPRRPDRRQLFAQIPAGRRIWAVASIHGEARRLALLHDLLWSHLAPGDRLIYLGNMLGVGPAVAEAVDELLFFRRAVMSIEPAEAPHVFYLRGHQEEMWQKLMQLQFSTDPRGVLTWMLERGVGSTLAAYGGSAEEARRAAAGGVLQISRWTQRLRASVQARPGHGDFMSALRRAAFTEQGGLLFVNAGLDPSRRLEGQGDAFWWGAGDFDALAEPYGGYRRVVRGYDLAHPGFLVGAWSATLDGGCGSGGPLLAACFLPSGEIEDVISA